MVSFTLNNILASYFWMNNYFLNFILRVCNFTKKFWSWEASSTPNWLLFAFSLFGVDLEKKNQHQSHLSDNVIDNGTMNTRSKKLIVYLLKYIWKVIILFVWENCGCVWFAVTTSTVAMTTIIGRLNHRQQFSFFFTLINHWFYIL
jgi:hypothetical protein